MPQPLTALERDILDWLVDYVRRHTYQPSIREIGARFAIKSTKTVSEYLQALADKGWVERDASRSRGVRLLGLDLMPDIVTVPVVDIHLGDPALDEPIETIALDRRMTGRAACFLATMIDDAMRDAGIRTGDLLLIESVTPEELVAGDIVAARFDGETVVRRYAKYGGRVVLEAANPAVPAIATPGLSRLDLFGRVRCVVRRLDGRESAELSGRPADEGALAS